MAFTYRTLEYKDPYLVLTFRLRQDSFLVARLDADLILFCTRHLIHYFHNLNTTMVEPIEVNETQSHPWDDLLIQHP
jgi:hypothetical protein